MKPGHAIYDTVFVISEAKLVSFGNNKKNAFYKLSSLRAMPPEGLVVLSSAHQIDPGNDTNKASSFLIPECSNTERRNGSSWDELRGHESVQIKESHACLCFVRQR